MRYLPLLIKKNLKILVRSKSSALIVIFAPLLMILLIGLSYGTSQTYGLAIGIHTLANSDVSMSLTDSLESRGYSVVQYSEVENCIDDVQSENIHGCVSLPLNFELSGNTAHEVTFYLDESKINIVWAVQEALFEELDLQTQELSESLVSDLFTKIYSAQTSLSTEVSTVDSLKSSNDNYMSNSESISSDLSSIDLSDLEYSIDQDLLDEFRQYTNSRILSAETSVENAQQALSDGNFTGSYASDIEDYLSDVDSDLEEVISLISGNGTYSYGQVEYMVAVLISELDEANSLVQSAADSVNDTTSTVSDLTISLSELSSSLSELSESLSTIETNLESLDVSDASVVSSPITTNLETINSGDSHLDYLFPVLLTLIVMFLSIMLGSTLVMIEKGNQAYVRNYLIPVKKITFVLATVLTNLVIIIAQLLIVLIIALLFIPESLSSMPFIFLALIFAATVFSLIGMVIGYVFSSEETGILASISTGSFFLFVSGVILPVEGMSEGLREITKLNPFVLTQNIIREMFIFQGSLLSVWEDFLILFFYGLVLFFLIMVIDSIVRKRIMERIMYTKHKKEREKERRMKERAEARKKAIARGDYHPPQKKKLELHDENYYTIKIRKPPAFVKIFSRRKKRPKRKH